MPFTPQSPLQGPSSIIGLTSNPFGCLMYKTDCIALIVQAYIYQGLPGASVIMSSLLTQYTVVNGGILLGEEASGGFPY